MLDVEPAKPDEASHAVDVSALQQWVTRPEVVWALSLSTLAMAACSLILVPVLVVRLPSDYFVRERPALWLRLQVAGPVKLALLLTKNLVGIVLAVLGLAMLVLPGQGLLTLLFAVVMLDFPGKHRFERRLIARPSVRNALDRIRAHFGRPPFDRPGAGASSD